MGVPGSANLLLLGGEQGYKISRSLRFNSADSAYLNRTPASAGNRKTYTISMWVKRAKLGATARLFGAYSTASAYFEVAFTSSDTLQWYYWNGSGYSYNRVTTQVFRDPSAWCHLVFLFNSPAATASQRIRIYFNGQEITTFSSSTDPTQNFDCLWNSTSTNVIADLLYAGSPGSTFDGMMTEIHHIDGQALTPSSFGETDTITGVWKPKKYAGTYGTNGFYLNFSDNSGTTSTTLGKDSSGNSNNWTPNNFSVTAGAGNDSMIDTPTPYADGGNGRGNYATWNPLDKTSSITLANGNLDGSLSSAAWNYAKGGFGMPASSGGWYWETTINTLSGGYIEIGIAGEATLTNNQAGYSATAYIYDNIQRKGNNGSWTTYGASWGAGDVIGCAFDSTNRTITFYKNGVSQGQAFSSISSGTYFPVISQYSTTSYSTNFGQRPFAYTPPSGFVALNTQNLPEPSIKKPSSYFDAKLYTGNNGTLTVTGLGFSPDLVWIKNRETAGTSHVLQDQVRGTTAYLQSNSTAAENTNTANNWFRAFTSDGFTVAATTTGGSATSEWNNNGSGYVAWCWDESATPGFDIVTYTAGSAGTVAHNLGVAPKMILLKDRTTAANWYVWHTTLAANQFLLLNSTAATGTSSTIWNNTLPTSTVFGTDNWGTDNMVAYLWSEVAGFSKFGSYTGNGSSQFVYLGFRPRWLLIKNTGQANDWFLLDSARSTYNEANVYLHPNSSSAEITYGWIDFLSNGFKVNNTGTGNNNNGINYIFAAFAEASFKFSLAK